MVNLEVVTGPEWEPSGRVLSSPLWRGGYGEEDGAGPPWLEGERGVV